MAEREDRRLRLPLRHQHRRQGRRRGGRSRSPPTLPDVVVAREYKFMCSDPGQELITRTSRSTALNRVVVAACSPRMHEPTFRRACGRGGPEPLPLPDGQHPRALLVGHRRPRATPPRRPSASSSARPPPAASTSRSSPSRCRSTRPCWSSAAASPASRPRSRSPTRQEGLPGREGAVHRRPHGAVRQDLPDARLRGLHPHAQDGRRSASTRTSS